MTRLTLDGFGGIHPFGAEPAIPQPGPFWNRDVARSIRIDDSGSQPPEGWIMDAYGGLHSFEWHPTLAGVRPPYNTIPVPPYPYWGSPLTVDLAEY